MPDPITIDVFTDYVCPWCYLSTASVERMEKELGVNVEWIPFPLNPSTPPEGLALSELFAGRDMRAAQAALEARMAEAGLEYHYHDHTYNTRLAQELGKWANTQPGGKAIHYALYRAYFVDGQNLARTPVLLDVARRCGLDVDAARQVLAQRSYRDAVDADWERARRSGITGVPSFVSQGLMVTGCQPWGVLENFVATLQARA